MLTGSSRQRRRCATAISDALISFLPLPQRLALSYGPGSTRQPVLTLLALDARLAQFVRNKRDPVLAQMRLAWWRDTLAKAPEEWPKTDPVLAALTGWEERNALVGLIDGWELLLGETLDEQAVDGFAGGRGTAFAALARVIGRPDAAAPAENAARIWALGDLAANLGDERERALVVARSRAAPFRREKLPRALRSLAVLEGLGRRSLARGGEALLTNPASGLVALRIGLSGR